MGGPRRGSSGRRDRRSRSRRQTWHPEIVEKSITIVITFRRVHHQTWNEYSLFNVRLVLALSHE
jgi:hypothetical protein